MSSRTIKSALISVFYKDNLDQIARLLDQQGVKIYSTGGTLKFISDMGIHVTPVETLTGFPEILDGRVKTLHPTVFGGILARREDADHMAQLAAHNIPTIDLVIVDLYPFEETVKNTSEQEEIIEKIDIGGIALIRAAAKNYNDTLIVSDRNQYTDLINLLTTKKGETALEDRRLFAARAFMTTSHYDTAIFNYFNTVEKIPVYKSSILESKQLRYGENPHQSGTFFGNLNEIFEILNGKELSYNNLVDLEAALQLIAEFTEPTFSIIKHTNACGLATRSNITEAYNAALACDTTSAFGGVLASNRKIDAATANAMNSLFFELVAAPDFETEALDILRQKKNRIIIKTKLLPKNTVLYKTLLNGVLAQQQDWSTETQKDFKVATNSAPSEKEITDLEFAVKAVKHLKSNGIAIVKDQQLLGMGCGQTSRVDALEFAIKKAKTFGFDTRGAVMASEAFFPFPDCVEIAHAAGIRAIAQPGGSIKDKDSIDAANKNGQTMVLTGIRHFKH